MLGIVVARTFSQIAFTVPIGMDSIAYAVTTGAPLPPMTVCGVIAPVVLCVAFILVAPWRFQRVEL